MKLTSQVCSSLQCVSFVPSLNRDQEHHGNGVFDEKNVRSWVRYFKKFKRLVKSNQRSLDHAQLVGEHYCASETYFFMRTPIEHARNDQLSTSP